MLLEIAEANTADLAALLGCSLFEAMQEKRLAAIGVLPYIAARQPIAIDLTRHNVVHLTIQEASEAPDQGFGLVARVIENAPAPPTSDAELVETTRAEDDD